MKIYLSILIAASPILLAGCQSSSKSKTDAPLQLTQYTPAASSSAPPHQGVISRTEALQNVLNHSPQIRSLRAEIRARDAEAYQASLPPNPTFEFEAENFGGTGGTNGFNGAELTGGLSQEFQLGQKRRKRTLVAQLAADMLRAELERETLNLQIATDQKFVNLMEAQSLKKIARQDVTIAEERLAAMRAQLDAGKISRLDLNKASIALASTKQELRRQESQSAKAAADLGRLWGGDGSHITRAEGSLSTSASLPSWSQIESAIARHPALSKSQFELARSEASLDLAKAQRIPNIEIGGGIRELRESDDTAAVIGFKIPLPLFDRNQGGIRAAEERITRAGSDRVAVRSSLLAQYQQYHAEALSARDRVRAFDSGMIDAARQSFDDNKIAYEEGKRDFIEYLDSQRTFFEVRRQEVQAKADLRRAKAAIECLLNHRPSIKTKK